MADSPVERARRRVEAQRMAALAVAVAGSAAAGSLILWGSVRLAGMPALIGGLALVTGAPSSKDLRRSRSQFLTRLVDRAFDFSVLVSLAWATRDADPPVAILSLVAAGLAYLAAYERARGESLGYAVRDEAGYRAARTGVLTAGLLTGWLEAAIWVFLILTGAAAAVRAANVARQARRTSTPAPPG
ncbi:MAG: hypothetical protein H0W94_07070 [Actinobacteria bacterium]|nr:hypothetical protein [Actinomycetota bacterium]